MLFRIADPSVQEVNAPMRATLESSRLLRDLGALHPDSEPTAYYHSIVQWAIWVDANELDRPGFEEAFVAHARKNFEAVSRDWTEEIEARVRGLVSNRWKEIFAMLEGAGRTAGSAPTPGLGAPQGID